MVYLVIKYSASKKTKNVQFCWFYGKLYTTYFVIILFRFCYAGRNFFIFRLFQFFPFIFGKRDTPFCLNFRKIQKRYTFLAIFSKKRCKKEHPLTEFIQKAKTLGQNFVKKRHKNKKWKNCQKRHKKGTEGVYDL